MPFSEEVDDDFRQGEQLVYDWIWKNRMYPVIGTDRLNNDDWMGEMMNYIDNDIDLYKEWVMEGNGIDEVLRGEYDFSDCIGDIDKLNERKPQILERKTELENELKRINDVLCQCVEGNSACSR